MPALPIKCFRFIIIFFSRSLSPAGKYSSIFRSLISGRKAA
jgi:hypothetical protein